MEKKKTNLVPWHVTQGIYLPLNSNTIRRSPTWSSRFWSVNLRGGEALAARCQALQCLFLSSAILQVLLAFLHRQLFPLCSRSDWPFLYTPSPKALHCHHATRQILRHDSCFFNYMPLYVLFKGLTDKMRNDFNVMKDLAVHTRLTPEQRQREVGRLIDYIHK